MKIALASARVVNRDIDGNLAQMARYMQKAKALGAVLVCFGEAFLQGFDALTWQYEADKQIALHVSSQPMLQIKLLTKEIGIDVLFGYNELDGESIYSACDLVSDGEVIHHYRRVTKGWKEYWKTDAHYKEGTEVTVFSYRGRKCLIGLCGDLWDEPERFTQGEELLFWPVYVSWTKEEWENGGKMEYAAQANLCCANTLYINSVCEGDAFGGALHFQNGTIQKELPICHEGLMIAEI